jgi:hypothetical protein
MVFMKIDFGAVSCLFLLLLSFGHVTAQIPSPDWDAILAKGDVRALVEAVRRLSPADEIPAALIEKLRAQPEMIQALLNHLRDKPPAAVAAPSQPEAPRVTGEVDTRPATVPVERGSLFDRLYEGLETANMLPDGKAVNYARQIEARAFLTRYLMDQSPDPVEDVERKNASPWIKDLAERSGKARKTGMPSLVFNPARGVGFSGSALDNGVKAYMSLFMVRALPEEGQTYDPRDYFILAHEKFPMKFITEKNDFEMSLIGRPEATVIRLKKELDERGEVRLYPGHWGVRVMHTDGRDRLRSNVIDYFTVEPGKTYIMDIRWEKAPVGGRQLGFALREDSN